MKRRALKWHYGASAEDKGLNEARANACEIVAWRLLTHLSEREAVEFCLYEIPEPENADGSNRQPHDEENGAEPSNETTSLLRRSSSSISGVPRRTKVIRRRTLLAAISKLTMSMTYDDDEEEEEEDPTKPFVNLNALEIAAVADAKRFLSQHVVQKIITGIWNGDIIFWDKLSIHTEKKPRFYNINTADPFSRLRVPKYLKAFEVVFFGIFLALYYSVLVERNPYRISFIEILLYLWFAAFTYDEISEWTDAGSIFYAADVWNVFDMIMIAIGFVFACMSGSCHPPRISGTR